MIRNHDGIPAYFNKVETSHAHCIASGHQTHKDLIAPRALASGIIIFPLVIKIGLAM